MNSGGGGQSVWPTILKVGGIGCAVLILVGVVLTAIGVFQIANCCSQLQDLGETADRAEGEAYEFALALHEGDYERAHRFLDESMGDEISVDELSAHFEQWREFLDASEPFPVVFSLDEDGFDLSTMGDSSRWFARTWFAVPAGGQEYLELYLMLEYEREDGVELKAGIFEWEVRITEAEIEEEPHTLVARTFHQGLRNGDFDRLSNHVYPGGQLPWPDSAELADHLGELSRRLAQLEPGVLWAVIPVDQTRLIVRYVVDDGQGSTYVVDYTVVAADNRIYDVSPLRPSQEVDDLYGDGVEVPAPEPEEHSQRDLDEEGDTEKSDADEAQGQVNDGDHDLAESDGE